MGNQRIFIAKSEEELARLYPIFIELRTGLSYPNYLAIYQQAHTVNGLTMVGLEREGEVVAVMGYRMLIDFTHGKHLYIDDLVTTAHLRSQGLGEQLLAYAKEQAHALGCRSIRLCTGIDNLLAQKFYQKHQMEIKAVALKQFFS